MALNSYNTRIIVHVILIAATGFVFFWSVTRQDMLITAITLGLAWILQILYLLHYIHRFQRDIRSFIEAFRNQDTSLLFKISRKNKYLKSLYERFNEIIRDFRLVRIEKEIEHYFFQETIQHVGSGLLAFNPAGDILLLNKAFLDMLNLDKIDNLSDLDRSFPELSDRLKTFRAGNQYMLKLLIGSELKYISINSSGIKLKDETVVLVALQDISREIDKSEVEAWQKLIRVLTHEIMNTVSPINLLSESLISIFEDNGRRKPAQMIDDQNVENALLGLHAILKRSAGLAKFVETYRSLTRLDNPSIEVFQVQHLFSSIKTLLAEDIKKRKVDLSISVTPKELTLAADEKLVEQVLINLVRNSLEALEETSQPSLAIRAFKNDNSVSVSVSDNGKGIPSEILESIFIPFFTTKKDGSGIGLSLSRQIMQMHNGSVKVKSEQGKGSTFTLEF